VTATFALNPASAAYAVIVYTESVAPAPTLTAPAGPLTDPIPAFGGTAGSDTGDADTLRLEVSDSTGVVATGTGSRVPGTGRWTGAIATPLADGTYTVKVTQEDAAGNAGSATAPLTIDTTGPAITIGAPADGASLALGEEVTAVFTCTDRAAVARCDAGATLDTAAPGEHRFTVVATDTLGNISTRVRRGRERAVHAASEPATRRSPRRLGTDRHAGLGRCRAPRQPPSAILRKAS
jgi:hypothetical protein